MSGQVLLMLSVFGGISVFFTSAHFYGFVHTSSAFYYIMKL
jgi:hypothetical protein